MTHPYLEVCESLDEANEMIESLIKEIAILKHDCAEYEEENNKAFKALATILRSPADATELRAIAYAAIDLIWAPCEHSDGN